MYVIQPGYKLLKKFMIITIKYAIRLMKFISIIIIIIKYAIQLLRVNVTMTIARKTNVITQAGMGQCTIQE